MNRTSLLAFVLLVMGCGREPEHTVDSANGTLSSGSSEQLRSAALAKPIDDYSGDEFYSHVRGLEFVGGAERNRRCRGCPAGQTTRVRVDGVSGVDSIGGANVPEFGIVVARGMNRGGQREDRYGMQPGARFEYYLIVLPALNGGPDRWRIEELEIRGSRYSRRQLAVGRVVPCNHPFTPGAQSDFRTCANAPDARPAAFMLLQAGGGGGDPWWYKCALGCCTAEDGGEG